MVPRLLTLNRIKKAAQIVKSKIIEEKQKVIVVVSAMGGVTNNLVKNFKEISLDTDHPEYDVILSTGEQYSSGVMSTVLNKYGIKSRSLLGWQIPIFTDSNYSKARIRSINSKSLKSFLSSFDALVIAGFQGLSEKNRITTLGRGGSDTTAVALAASIKSNLCEIYTDVEGIYSSDPRIVNKAKKIKNITYEEILEMSSAGSKVLHPRSVELAMKYGIKIHVRSSFSKKTGTMVVKEEKKLEKEVVTGISASDNEANISLKGIPDKPGIAGKIFALLSNANINVDMIVQNITDDGKYTSLTFTVPVEDCSRSVNALKVQKLNSNILNLITIFAKFQLWVWE